MKRERATALLEELLERVIAGGRWLDLIDELYVFGSYARGALEPGDIDLAVAYTSDAEATHHFVRALAEGRDWNAPMRKALRGNRRGFEFSFQDVDRLSAELGFEPVLIYRRGDTLADAVARLRAIREDPTAGRAEREAMLPEFEGLDKHLRRPLRATLVELRELGVIAIDRVALRDDEPRDDRARGLIDRRYKSKTSRAKRAVCASVAWLEHAGCDVEETRIGDRPLRWGRKPIHMVSWTLDRFNTLPAWIREDTGGQWLHVVNPSVSKPLAALRITVLDSSRLPITCSRLFQ